jgi:hypothetical protein
MSYEQRVSLSLNADRIHATKTLQIVDALEVFAGKRIIPDEWLTWIARSPDEAQKLIAEQNLSLLRDD